MPAFKPLEEIRPETEAEEFNRLFPEGSEVRRVKELDLAEKGIPIPGQVESIVSLDDPELKEFLAWKKSRKAADDHTQLSEELQPEPDSQDVVQPHEPERAWR